MNKQAWLKLDGSLEEGFRVSIDVRDDSQIHPSEAEGKLPANPKLARCLKEWQQSYHQLPGAKRIVLDDVIVEMINPREVCLQKRDALERCFKDWLSASSFRAIERQIRGNVSPTDTLRIIVRAQDDRLHYLPWHLWDLVEEDYKHAEVALGTLAKPFARVREPGEKVRVLAILGDSEGIDTESDQKQLNLLPNADITPLSEPSRQQINDHLWDQDWDVLFFAGHSRTKQPKDKQTERPEGIIYINANDSLTIKELKYGLERAIARGLQLAIFNSCDGLGLAYKLEQLHIPQLIVMREPVPDRVAQEFLKRFLEAFAKGESLYAAVRYARERLQGLEGEFPCASWLPVIVQNPAVIPSTWADLWQLPPEPPPVPKRSTRIWRQILAVLVTSVLVTGGLMGVRSMGILQAHELQAYDQLLRQRPQELSDSRLALITITEEDFRLPEQQNRKGSLSDEALELILRKLEPFQPRGIGLDVLRDSTVNPKFKDLQRLIKQDNIFGSCLLGNSQALPGTAPPPEISPEQIGFINTPLDEPYSVLRRHLLHMDVVGTHCSASEVLSLKLAFHYLERENITPQFTPQGYLQLGNVVFEPLAVRPGAYQRINHFGGDQVLLNYRSVAGSPSNLVELRFSLKQVLAGHPRLSEVRDRIVLIGVDAPSVGDDFLIPYTQQASGRLLGVIVQAQMISQILSAVLDGRPLLKPWNSGYELLWVWLWTGVCGGLVVFWGRSVYLLFGLICGSLLLLYFLCYWMLNEWGFWVPLVPTALSLFINAATMTYLVYRHQNLLYSFNLYSRRTEL